MQRRRITGAGAGARGCGPHHHPPVSRKSPARDESSFGCVVQTRQFLFVLQLLKPMDGPFDPMGAPFDPSTSCQGAHYVFVVFLLHHPVGGWAFVGPGVSMGPLSADTQPPPSSADSAWFLTQNSGFAGHGRRRRNRAPPQTPLVLRTGNRNGTRISISVYLRFQK